jgi:signal peptidase II
MTRTNSKWLFYGVIVGLLVGLDILTKQLALQSLNFGETSQFLGFIPFTLTFNEGGGFSLSFGEASRWIFTTIAIGIFIVLFAYLLKTPSTLRLRIIAISMISAGALGNLIDRVRWDLGVVDFIGPIDLGFMLWPIFNIADMSVSIGGALLVLSFWTNQPEVVEGQQINEEVVLEE